MSNAPLMLSVSGARGIVGESMTPAVAANFAAAVATFIKDSTGRAQPLVCIGRDSRPSGESLSNAATAALTAAGCRVIDLGVVATPTVGVMIDERSADGGIVITASHNPGQWNGLKVLDATGAAPPAPDVERILQHFRSRGSSPPPADGHPTSTRDDGADDIHINRVLAAIDPEPIRAARLKVVLDSVNGAGGVAGLKLLDALGSEVVHMNGEPTGLFAHAPEPTEENLRDLAVRTREENAACGFAQDPDADRLAIIDETGRYIGEEYTLVLAAKRILETHRSGSSSTLVANLSTSRMIDDLAAQFPGASVVRSAVGEANVVAAMRQHDAILGGEGNGGVILPPRRTAGRSGTPGNPPGSPHAPTSGGWVRDSLAAMALTLSLLAEHRKPLSAIVAAMPRYAMVKEKIDFTQISSNTATGAERDALIKAAIDRAVAAFQTSPDVRMNTTDGVRFDLPAGSAWIHLRPSNTEPIIRIIAEAPTEVDARSLIETALGCIRNLSPSAT